MKLSLKLLFFGFVVYIVGAFFAPDMNNATVLEKSGFLAAVIGMGFMGFAVGVEAGKKVTTETTTAH